MSGRHRFRASFEQVGSTASDLGGSETRRRRSLPPDLSRYTPDADDKPLPPLPLSEKGKEKEVEGGELSRVDSGKKAKRMFSLESEDEEGDGDEDGSAENATGEGGSGEGESREGGSGEGATSESAGQERGRPMDIVRRERNDHAPTDEQAIIVEPDDGHKQMPSSSEEGVVVDADTRLEAQSSERVLSTSLPEVETHTQMKAQEEERERRRLRTLLKRYHALTELLSTEAGYLADLRALVTVSVLPPALLPILADYTMLCVQIYLDQLALLSSGVLPGVSPSSFSASSPSLSPTSPSSRPLSLSGLGRSNRSSFLGPSTGSSPSLPPTSPHPHSPSQTQLSMQTQFPTRASLDEVRERDRDMRRKSRDIDGGPVLGFARTAGEWDRQRQRVVSTSVFPSLSPLSAPSSASTTIVVTRADMEKVERNARELLDFHERFVRELRGAVSSLGLSGALKVPGDADWIEKQSEEKAQEETEGEVERTDEAVDLVSGIFVREVRFVFISCYLCFLTAYMRPKCAQITSLYTRPRISGFMRPSVHHTIAQRMSCARYRLHIQLSGKHTSSVVRVRSHMH